MASERPRDSDFFECTQCGVCCKGYGGTYVSEADMAAIAEYVNLPVHIARERFCVLSGGKLLLAQSSDGYCVFWKQNCTIHPVKPLMCRRWPFIPSLLVDVANWYIMADSCPGIHPKPDEYALRAYVREVIGSAEK